jgi:hypothetical protein
MLVTNMPFKRSDLMTSHRILQLNAVSTAVCALGMLATRGTLHAFFGLDTSILLDLVAIGLLLYAGALAFVAGRQPVTRQALMAFTVADGLWVGVSVIVLLVFWDQLAPIARFLIVAVGLVVEIFATLQFRAARRVPPRSVQVA